MLPLSGIRVIELGAVVLGPYAAQWLGDLGAEVIKVEAPTGDSTRRTGPTAEFGMASLFLGLNRNKRSIVLDLKTKAGKEALLRLVDTADVLLHNNRPHKMKALGLDSETLIAHNPRLIYACLHGFAENGPYGGRPAYDDVIQGMCGLADLMGQQTGTPRYLPTVAADKTSGLVGAIGILGLLVRRERTGLGGYVEVPMFETMVAFTAVEHLYGLSFDPPLGQGAYPRVMVAERGPFTTKDGHICVMPYTDKHWQDMFKECGRPDLAAEPRFQGITSRTQYITEIYGELAHQLTSRTTAEWLSTLLRLEIPCAPVQSIDDLVTDPHLEQTDFFAILDNETGPGKTRYAGVPILFDGNRPPIARPPRLGEHTEEILTSLLFENAKIE
nr:CoA transferase [Sphingobium sp. SJ10-10]